MICTLCTGSRTFNAMSEVQASHNASGFCLFHLILSLCHSRCLFFFHQMHKYRMHSNKQENAILDTKQVPSCTLHFFFSCSFFSSTWELYRCVLWRCIGCITSFHIYEKITTAFRWLGGGGVERSKVKENGKVLLLCINHRGDTDDYHMRTLAVDCSYTTYAHIYDWSGRRSNEEEEIWHLLEDICKR